MESAVERVDRLLARLSRHDAPICVGVDRSVDETTVEDARDDAFMAADGAGRGQLLDLSIDRIERAYAARLSGEGLWTGLVAMPIPSSASDRARSQLIVEDLVTALIVEDLASEDVLAILRADGERMLRLGADSATAEDDGGPPVDPFRGPFVGSSVIGTVFLALAWFSDPVLALAVVVLAPPVIWIRRRGRRGRSDRQPGA